MARPATDALTYFNVDTKASEELSYIEAIHGIEGYAVIHKLWQHIYSKGYFCEWTEVKQKIFASVNKISFEKLQAIMYDCFAEGIELFDKSMYDNHKILTSVGIQKRWKKIVVECGRVNNKIADNYCLIDQKMYDDTPENSDETEPPVELPTDLKVVSRGGNGEEMPQSKVKEIKVNESIIDKEKDTSQNAPSPAIFSEKDKIYNAVVAIWFDFNHAKFNDKPSFSATDGKKLKSIVEKLRRRAASQKVEWTENVACDRLQKFLEAAYEYDTWLPRNFLLKNLESQFDSVVMNQKGKVTKNAESKSVLSLGDLKKKFTDNTLKILDIQKAHFEQINGQECELKDYHFEAARKKRIESLVGSNQRNDLELADHYLKKEETFLTKQDYPNLELMAQRFAVRDWLYVQCVEPLKIQ